MRYNYTHSDYMLENESHTVEEMVANHEWAEFLHHVDMIRIKSEVARAAGVLSPTLDFQCMMAIDDRSIFKMRYFIGHLDRLIDGIVEAPTPVAAPSLMRRIVTALAA